MIINKIIKIYYIIILIITSNQMSSNITIFIKIYLKRSTFFMRNCFFINTIKMISILIKLVNFKFTLKNEVAWNFFTRSSSSPIGITLLPVNIFPNKLEPRVPNANTPRNLPLYSFVSSSVLSVTHFTIKSWSSRYVTIFMVS